MHSILVIDDSPEIQNLLNKILSPYYKVYSEEEGMSAMETAIKLHPDLILLDLNLPGIDGLELCNQFQERAELEDVPIIVLSAKTGPNIHTMAYKLGADNYLEKPFNQGELLALIESKFKHLNKSYQKQIGNVQIDLKSFSLTIDGKFIDLTPKEFKTLAFLFEHIGEVISREEILRSIWGETRVTDRVIDNHINSLRKKITGSTIKIESIYSEGYRATVDVA